MLFPPRADDAVIRGVSTDEFLSLIEPALCTATQPETVTLLPFSKPVVRSCIHEAKYHGSERAFTLLGLALVDYLRDGDDARRPVIIPVPLGKTRRRERGFNQVEEVIRHARNLSEFESDPDTLVRKRETSSQVSLARKDREENMRGAFSARTSLDASKTYIIIDDVLTTGATLQACINALRAAGAQHIIPLALAH